MADYQLSISVSVTCNGSTVTTRLDDTSACYALLMPLIHSANSLASGHRYSDGNTALFSNGLRAIADTLPPGFNAALQITAPTGGKGMDIGKPKP